MNDLKLSHHSQISDFALRVSSLPFPGVLAQIELLHRLQRDFWVVPELFVQLGSGGLPK